MKNLVNVVKNNMVTLVVMALIGALATHIATMPLTVVSETCNVVSFANENNAVCETEEGEKFVIVSENGFSGEKFEATVEIMDNGDTQVKNIFGFVADGYSVEEFDMSNPDHLTDYENNVKDLFEELHELEQSF